MQKRIYLALAFLISFLPAVAQQITIEFGETTIPIETYFTISVRLKGTALKQPFNFPELEGFQKSNRFTTRKTLKSGNNIVEEVHTQNYAALHEGTFVVEPFSLTINNKVVTSQKVIIQVGPVGERIEASAGSQNSKSLPVPDEKGGTSFLSLETNKKSVFVGEEVHLGLYFYLASTENGQLQFYDFLKQLPELFKQLKQPNTWEETFEQKEVVPDTLTIRETKFLRYKLYEAVYFPFIKEDLIFPALQLKMIQVLPSPDGLFAEENKQSAIKVFTSRPKQVKVKSLPPHPLREGVPVGRFRLDETINRREVQVNNAITYSFAVIGEGNIAALPAPVLQNNANLEIYPPQVNQKKVYHGRGISGSKQFTFSLVPKESGNYNLRDLFRFIYFDPVREQYDTLESRYTVTVKGALNKDAAIRLGAPDDFYNLIETEDNTLVSIHKFEKLKLYTNLIVLLLLAISVYIFFRNNNE